MNPFDGSQQGPFAYPQDFTSGPSGILSTAAFDATRLTYSGPPPQSWANTEQIGFAGNLATSCIDALSRQIHQLQYQLTSANQHNGWLEEQWRFKCEDCNNLEERLRVAEQRIAKDKEHLKSFHVQLEKANQRISSLEVDLEITKSVVAAEALSRAELQERLNSRTSELGKTKERLQSTKDELTKAQRMITEENVARLQAEAKLRNANERIGVLKAAANSLVRESDATHSSGRAASPFRVDSTSAGACDKEGATPCNRLMHVINNVKLETSEEQHLHKETNKQTTLLLQNEPSDSGTKRRGKARAPRQAVKRTSTVDAHRFAPKLKRWLSPCTGTIKKLQLLMNVDVITDSSSSKANLTSG